MIVVDCVVTGGTCMRFVSSCIGLDVVVMGSNIGIESSFFALTFPDIQVRRRLPGERALGQALPFL